ncbi:MAG: hypothetical protein CMI86_02100 [Candidatus Pelagibacter sp.]|nr:hypothetical protein [Candidatus Pelagibacter sp.]|tara:strand:- start:2044 stop:2679 length:636 start_codon:yes stop_codon:yes gene_type:complete
MNRKYKIIKRFGPSVLKVKIPKQILNKLNNYIDNITKNKKKISKLNYGNNLVGDVTEEFKLEKNFMKKSGWEKFLKDVSAKWIKSETEMNIRKFKIVNSWVVRQFENEYNPTHWHSGHISGAGFLKVPKSFGRHVQKKTNREYRGGNLQLIHGSRMFLNHSTLNIKPVVGDFYLFPNYLMHSVFPFKNSNEERRSISFNALIDQKIYNVYG